MADHIMIYNIDIVLCIDLTCKMLVELRKIDSSIFLSDLEEAMKHAGKVTNDIRIKIIGFGDIESDDVCPIVKESRFFNNIKKEFFGSRVRICRYSAYETYV